jgi:hypothetical protein
MGNHQGDGTPVTDLDPFPSPDFGDVVAMLGDVLFVANARRQLAFF